MTARSHHSKKIAALVAGITLCVGMLMMPTAQAAEATLLGTTQTDLTGVQWAPFVGTNLTLSSDASSTCPAVSGSTPLLAFYIYDQTGDSSDYYTITPGTIQGDTTFDGTTGEWSVPLLRSPLSAWQLLWSGYYEITVSCYNDESDFTNPTASSPPPIDLGTFRLAFVEMDVAPTVSTDWSYSAYGHGFLPTETVVASISGNGVDEQVGTGVVDELGQVTIPFVVPSSVALGNYTITLTGSTTGRYIDSPITVSNASRVPVTLSPASGKVARGQTLTVSGSGCDPNSGLYVGDATGNTTGWADFVKQDGTWVFVLSDKNGAAVPPAPKASATGTWTMTFSCMDINGPDMPVLFAPVTFTVTPASTYDTGGSLLPASGGAVGAVGLMVALGIGLGAVQIRRRTA